MRYSLGSLRVFATVAEVGSITVAGEKLGRTPSAVSTALKSLESEVGAPLFERERKNRLSRVGLFVLAEARELLAHHERTVASIRAFAGNQAGRVDIASVPSVAVSVLPEVLVRFGERYPGVEINVRDADSRSVAEAVERGKVTLGVASLAHAPPALRLDPLFQEPLGIVCRSDDPLASARCAVEWHQVSDRAFLGNGISMMMGEAGGAGPMPHAPVVVHNVLSLLALVRAGLGVTILPHLSIASIREGFAFVPLADPSACRSVGLITRAIERSSPAEAAFVAELRAVLHARAADLGIRIEQ